MLAELAAAQDIEDHFVRKGCAGQLKIAIILSVFDNRPSLRAQGSHLRDRSLPPPALREKRNKGENN